VIAQAGCTIPFRLRIGVTGHRTLSDPDELVARVQQALQHARGLIRVSAATTVCFAAISPLAEGADRLVARAVLEQPGATLEAVLPLPADDYERDFSTEESRCEFHELLAAAARVVELPGVPTREEAYEQVGQYVVERCDALIAIWDGDPAQGPAGTASVVGWARDRGVPVFWIHAKPPYALTVWAGNGIDPEAYRPIDDFNSAFLPPDKLSAEVARAREDLLEQAARAGLDRGVLDAYCAWALPCYERADLLALRAQDQFARVSDATFICAALAVVASAGPQLAGTIPFLSQLRLHTSLRFAPLMECLLMGFVLFVLYLGRRQRLHQRWITLRFLAERLRAAIFLAVLSPAEQVAQRIDLERPHQESDDWLARAFDEVWQRRPRAAALPPVEPLRRFLLDAWIGNQQEYQVRKCRRHERAHRLISTVSLTTFAVTLAIAALATIGADQAIATLVLYLSIVLPALAGALGGIGALREHPRNAHRSRQMARTLARLKERMARAPDLPTLHLLVRETEDLMLQEYSEWFVTMRFRDVHL